MGEVRGFLRAEGLLAWETEQWVALVAGQVRRLARSIARPRSDASQNRL